MFLSLSGVHPAIHVNRKLISPTTPHSSLLLSAASVQKASLATKFVPKTLSPLPKQDSFVSSKMKFGSPHFGVSSKRKPLTDSQQSIRDKILSTPDLTNTITEIDNALGVSRQKEMGSLKYQGILADMAELKSKVVDTEPNPADAAVALQDIFLERLHFKDWSKVSKYSLVREAHARVFDSLDPTKKSRHIAPSTKSLEQFARHTPPYQTGSSQEGDSIHFSDSSTPIANEFLRPFSTKASPAASSNLVLSPVTSIGRKRSRESVSSDTFSDCDSGDENDVVASLKHTVATNPLLLKKNPARTMAKMNRRAEHNPKRQQTELEKRLSTPTSRRTGSPMSVASAPAAGHFVFSLPLPRLPQLDNCEKGQSGGVVE